jgi:hypothetical protein
MTCNDADDISNPFHLAVSQIGNTHDPSDQSGGSAQIIQPSKDRPCRSGRSTHERQQPQTSGHGRGVNRESSCGTFPKDLGGLALEGKRE